MNICILMGRLTKEPELRSTQNGVSVVQFTIAVDRDFVRQGEERQSDFINCVAFRQTADFVAKYFGKGRMIAVQGSVQVRSYDKNGEKRYVTEVIVDRAHFTGEKRRDGGDLDYIEPDDIDRANSRDPDVLSDQGIPF